MRVLSSFRTPSRNFSPPKESILAVCVLLTIVANVVGKSEEYQPEASFTRNDGETYKGGNVKKPFLFILLALAGVAGLIIPASAQAQDQIVAKIPFQFVAAGQALPAGEYRISRLSDSEPNILLLSSLENHANVAILRAVSKEPANAKTKLDFTTVGDQRFLSRIETADNAYELAVPSAEALQAATAHPNSASPLFSGSN